MKTSLKWRARLKASVLLCASAAALGAADAWAAASAIVCGADGLVADDDGVLTARGVVIYRIEGEPPGALSIATGSRFRLTETDLGTVRVELLEGYLNYRLEGSGVPPPIQVVHQGTTVSGYGFIVSTFVNGGLIGSVYRGSSETGPRYAPGQVLIDKPGAASRTASAGDTFTVGPDDVRVDPEGKAPSFTEEDADFSLPKGRECVFGDGASRWRLIVTGESEVPAGTAAAAGNGGAPDSSRFSIGLEAAYLDYDFDPIGVGVVLKDGGEHFVAKTGDTFDSVGFGGRIEYVRPEFGGFSLHTDYFEHEGSAAGSVATNTNVTGIVNLDFNPNNGSTGMLFSSAGLDARIDYDFDYLRIGGGWTPPERWRFLPGGLEWGGTLEYARSRQSYWTTAEPPAFGGQISDTREIDVTHHYLDFGIEVERPFALGPEGRFGLTPFGSFGGTHFDTVLNAIESFVCEPCAPANNFNLAIRDEKDGITWNADFGLRAEYNLGGGKSGFGVYAEGRYEIMGGTARVFIPRTGNDLFLDNRAAGLEDENGTRNRFVIVSGLRFGF